jgi:hypothetical protein
MNTERSSGARTGREQPAVMEFIEDLFNEVEETESHFCSELTTEQHKKKRVRKNRTFKFFCGCGKGYTSTPALYLHIKIKHEGVMPHGTVYPNLNRKHRGRPIVNSFARFFNVVR